MAFSIKGINTTCCLGPGISEISSCSPPPVHTPSGHSHHLHDKKNSALGLLFACCQQSNAGGGKGPRVRLAN